MTIVTRLSLLLLDFYRSFISPFLGNHCRFYPSCSAYSVQVFRGKGFVKGIFLTLARLLRCHPFCHGGYDPVE